jgi:hypothetical protein
LRQRLGRYAGNKKTHLLGFVNSHFANVFHSTKVYCTMNGGALSRLDPSFSVVNYSLQT